MQKHQLNPQNINSNKSARRTPILQQSQSSQNSTFDKLQSLKPLRESHNQIRPSTTQSNLQRQKTPITQNRNDNHESKNSGSQIKSQSNFTAGKSLKSSRNNNERKESQKSLQLDLYNSVDSRTPNINQQYYSRHREDELQKMVVESKNQRDASQNNIGTQQDTDNGLSIYVIKNKKGQQNSQSLYKQQFLSKAQTSQAAPLKPKSRTNNHEKTPNKYDEISSVKSSRRDDSKGKYSAIKSKVKSHLRSKTPKAKGAVLTQQQHMDQNEKKLRRQQEINQLENEVQQIQNDLQFKQSNKDLILDTYKSKQSLCRKNTDPNILQLKNQSENGDALQDSTDESTHRVSLKSKKQFSQFEYQLQTHNFNDKYFDKVYLELCGFSNVNYGKDQLLEKERSQTVIQKQQQTFGALSPRASQQLQCKDIIGSVTFFERRTDKVHCKNSLEHLAQYDSETPIPPDELELEYAENEHFTDSPTQIRRVDNFDREDFMNVLQANRQDHDLLFGDEDQRKKRDEMRMQNQKLVEDFDTVLEDLINQRKTASHMAFYEAINEYDYDKKQLDNALYKDPNGSFQLAQSPTKRLICMKNSTIEHFKHIKDRNLVGNSSDKNNMVYMASPERSYVVTSSQKIDYTLAYKKNPSKFYDEAMNAPITKHKIQHQRPSLSPKSSRSTEKRSTLGSQSSHSMSQKNFKTLNVPSTAKKSNRDHEIYSIVSKQTTRPHNRINQKIKSKIEQKLADKLGTQLTQQVLKALEDANLQEAINDIISQNSNQMDDNYHQVHQKISGEKTNKAMSVRSLQVQKQFDDFNVKGDCESNHHDDRRQNQLMIQSTKKETSSVRNPVTRELRTNSNIVYNANDKSGPSGPTSHRSGAISKQYVSENNHNMEEDVKINKAY